MIQTLCVSILLIACQANGMNEELTKSLNSRPPLTIAVVGKPPQVAEKNIQFRQIELGNLKEGKGYHALFIMPEYQKQASEPQFKAIYKKLNYPIFIMGAKKSVDVYMNDDIGYDDLPDSKDGMYAIGFAPFESKEEKQTFGFGLYNDVESKEIIKGTYSLVFQKIYEVLINRSL
ncbi:hypothetical protein [Baia soyae]|uniref:Uncharacterized protein n=1 Tax=Baia soyae TaxID=1544746 RepID=A0A4R2RGL8_9BACL|nr:hypothetical protein [Baia soyae]TCP61549.1 hypothetical protein EDD57_16011 [Baia soyae]